MAALPDLKRECGIRKELCVATVELLGGRSEAQNEISY